MDLAGHAGPFLCDRPSELRGANRPPDADEQDSVGDDAQEVALRDDVARELWCEHVVELGEQRHRRPESEPAVEVLSVPAIANREAEPGEQSQEREERERQRHLERPAPTAARVERRERRPSAVQRDPEREQAERDDRESGDEGAPPQGNPRPGHDGRERDQDGGEKSRAERRPRLHRPLRLASEQRNDREGERADSGDAEPGGEQQVEKPPFHLEAGCRQDRDDRRREHDGRVENQPPLRQHIGTPQRRIRQEERRRRAEQRDEEQRADDPRLERLSGVLAHITLIGRRFPADEGKR